MSTRSVLIWALTLPAAALLLLAGLAALSGAEHGVQLWGEDPGLRTFIGICDVAGGIALLIPRTALWACAGLVLLTLGSIYNYLTHGSSPALPILVLALVTLVGALRLRQAGFASLAEGERDV